MSDVPTFLTVPEVAIRLGLSTDYVYEHAAELGGVKLGRKWKFAPATFLAAVEAIRLKDNAETAPAVGTGALPSSTRRLSRTG